MITSLFKISLIFLPATNRCHEGGRHRFENDHDDVLPSISHLLYHSSNRHDVKVSSVVPSIFGYV